MSPATTRESTTTSGAPVVIDSVLSPTLRASIDRAMNELPATKRGQFAAGVSLTGAEVSLTQRLKWDFLAAGYAKRLWGGGYEAGARVTKTW